MHISGWKYLVVFCLLLGLLVPSSFGDDDTGQVNALNEVTEAAPALSLKRLEDRLDRIRRTGQIIVLTREAPRCFYTHGGVAMGFEYELAKAFAEHLGVDLEVKTLRWGDMIQALNQERGDFAAAGIVVDPFRQKLVDFSRGYLSIQPRVVIHKDDPGVRAVEDLSGRTIHVRKRSSHEQRLHELREGGLDITLALHEGVPAEELIRRVAEQEIAMTVADSDLAFLNRRYYPDIEVGIPLEEPQPMAWAVKKGEKRLLHVINTFLDTVKANGTFHRIHKTYYGNSQAFDRFDIKKFHERIRTRLPRYEKTIKRAATAYGFDWRLIAAVIYQESQFDPQARSHRGVRGLMQLTDLTAKEVGVTDRLNPEQSIMGGVKYLRKLYRRYDEAKGFDRMLITLASYNVGHRHIRNAQRIARQEGLKPYQWSSLEKTLPLLCREDYLKTNKFGYCRGREPVHYVNRILLFFDILRRQAIGETSPARLTQRLTKQPGLDSDYS